MSLGGRVPTPSAAQSDLHSGEITFTHRASEPHEELAESQQVNWVEGGAASGNPSKLVYRIDVGQIGRNRAQPPLVVKVGDPILAPVAAPTDEVELASRPRMKGVGDADPAVGRTRTISSRQCGAKPKLRLVSRWSGAGFWRGCGTSASSCWPILTRQSGH